MDTEGGLTLQKVEHIVPSACYISNYGGNSGSSDAPVESKDHDGVQNNIEKVP